MAQNRQTRPPQVDEQQELRWMGIAIMAGQSFENAVARGVRDTPENRASWERMKEQIADIVARGRMPDFEAD